MSAGATPPPLPKAYRRQRVWPFVVAGVACALGAMAYFAFDFYRLRSFPPGYRNKPTSGWHRPGLAEFNRADELIDAPAGTNAFGNTAEAASLAYAFSETIREARQKFFTPEFKFALLDSQLKGQFVVFCELHRDECAFIVHVPGLRHFDKDFTQSVDARRALAQIAWLTAQNVLKERAAGHPNMELAVALRGISQYSPIMIGYHRANPASAEDGIVKYLDDGTQTHYLWTFFAPRDAAGNLQ